MASRAETTLNLMREVFRGLAKRQDEAWLHTELSMAQVKALVAIGKDQDPPVGVVAKELGIGLSAASQIVERLVKAGLVERRAHPSDRRVTQCLLSHEGASALEQFQSGPRLLQSWLEQLDADDLENLEKGLSALVSHVRNQHSGGDEK